MQTMNAASWADFKSKVESKRLLMQYIDCGEKYAVSAPEGMILWVVTLLKDGGDDVADFEANHKPTANQAVGVAHSPFSAGEFEFCGKAAGPLTVQAGTTNTIHLLIEETLFLDGGMVYAKGGAVGDYITAKICDIDNILGMGADTVLKTYIEKWFIIPNSEIDIRTPYAGKILEGLYLCVSYTSTGDQDVEVFGNYRLHRRLA